MEKKDFLIEIGCEEIPADLLMRLAQELSDSIQKELTSVQLSYQNIQTYATPQRIAVAISALDGEQPSREIEKLGPNLQAAYDAEGKPTAASLGFARSCGVEFEKLQTKDTGKEKRLYYKIQQPGIETSKILPPLINNSLKKIANIKSMRWGNSDTAFIRPIHWILMLFGKDPLQAEILGIKTSNLTKGHRFMSPGVMTIKDPEEYVTKLKEQGFVIADFQARKELIRKQIQNIVDKEHQAIINEELLDEVTGLVEWPIALQGTFAKKFLSVPKEVLIASMQSHQKCFPVEDAQGHLQPYFILISNIESKNPQIVIQGNERVINARLSDAEFFYQQDLNHSLESRYAKLKGLVFQQKLGSMADKSERLVQLSSYIAKELNCTIQDTARAAHLSKCDLLTDMVFEFPNLQGLMGYYYALNDQEKPEIAKALFEQYLPRFAGDELPHSSIGSIVALADRLDTLIGIFGINQPPTGEKDPFALRRAAQGVLRILIEKKLSLDLLKLLEHAKNSYQVSLPNSSAVDQVYTFIMTRLKSWYLDQGVTSEVFESVAARKPSDLVDFAARINAVLAFQKLPEAQSLSAANKRVSNILKNIDVTHLPAINPEFFENDYEKNLAHMLTQEKNRSEELAKIGNYQQALCHLSTLKEPIDSFFDKVMVMVDDEKIRNNRLSLLLSLRTLLTNVADIALL